jgi:hypothetical protein
MADAVIDRTNVQLNALLAAFVVGLEYLPDGE